MSNPRRSIGLTIFGIIFLIFGLCLILYPLFIYIKFKTIGIQSLPFIGYLPLIITPFTLIGAVFCIIVSMGIFRLKFWAWYLVIADAIIRFLGLFTPIFIFGCKTFDLSRLALPIGAQVFILWFFLRSSIKNQFFSGNERFRLKSWYAALIILLLAITLLIPGFVIGYKVFNSVKRKQPFLLPKPQLVKLTEKNNLISNEGFRKREIFNLSVLLPKDFIIRSFNKEGILVLGDIEVTNKAVILIGDKSALDIMSSIYKIMRFKNTYQFEEAIYTENWGFIFLVLRDIEFLHHRQVKIFDSSTFKGFIKYGHEKDKDTYDFSIYDKLNNGIGNIMLIQKEKYLSEHDVWGIISSLNIAKKQSAEEYYQNGLQLLGAGDSVNAQFAFANAYYYNPKKVEYGYMLAKSLISNGRFSLYAARNILVEILQLKPDYFEAIELLESLKNIETEPIKQQRNQEE